MARPKKINPNGKTTPVTVLVPEPLARELNREAKRRGLPLSEIVRERLSRAA